MRNCNLSWSPCDPACSAEQNAAPAKTWSTFSYDALISAAILEKMKVQHVSTRGEAPALGFADALLAGLARDGGLYMPQTWPDLGPGRDRGFCRHGPMRTSPRRCSGR